MHNILVYYTAITVLLLFSFIQVVKTPVYAANLLLNPSFEEGITSWSLYGTTATFSATSQAKKSGNNSALLTKENSSSWAYFYQRVNIEAGKYYKLGGWVRLNDDYINNIKLRFYWLSDSSGTKISSTPIEIPTQTKSADFQFLQTDLGFSPDNALFAEVQGYVHLNTKNPATPALFDDILFEESVAPTTTPTPIPTNTPTSTNVPTPTKTPTPTNTPTPTKTSTPTPIPTKTQGATILDEKSPSAGEAGIVLSENIATETPTPTPEVLTAGFLERNLSKILIIIGGVFLVSCSLLFLKWKREKDGESLFNQ